MQSESVSEVANPRRESPFCLLRQGLPTLSRHRLCSPATTIGRAPDNDLILTGPDAGVVSVHHAEVREQAGQWILRELESTNGTFVDGERRTEAALAPGSVIQLGPGGPVLTFAEWEDDPGPRELNRTIAVAPPPPRPGLGTESDRLLGNAVAHARHARWSGALNQTGAIMREALASAVAHSSRRFRRVIAVLTVLLVAVTAFGAWKIRSLGRQKIAIDRDIGRIEQGIQAAVANPSRMDSLILELDRYEAEAQALQHNPLYRLRPGPPPDPVDPEIRSLLAGFGAEVYSIPPEFRVAVIREIHRYQGPERPLMARAIGEAGPLIGRIGRVLERNHLPRDFAYMVLVESAMDRTRKSAAGCAGLWQLTPDTARTLGLRVGQGIDQRLDVNKSTQAASEYIRGLILDFGAGSSVMLALAAYDVGPARVKQAIHRVSDPIRQRDFWYLYRSHALPEETREYVPRVVAAMIIGRRPSRYGF